MFESLDFNTCMLIAAGGTIYFCSKPKEEREEIAGNILWYVTNKYYQIKIALNELYNNTQECYGSYENSEDEAEDKNLYEIVSYNKSPENGIYIAEVNSVNLDELYDYNVDNELTFVKYIENNKFYLKRLENKEEVKEEEGEGEEKEEVQKEENEEEVQEEQEEEVEEEVVEEEDVEEEEVEEEEDEEDTNLSINIVPVTKPFMQIDYEDENNKIEIQGELEKFYVKDNKLFDKEFLEWYMEYYYQTKISDNYTIHILDENIKMFKINKDQYIVITNDGDINYKVLNN